MPREFKCQKCGLSLGEMSQGKLRLRAVLLCGYCWHKADTAMNVAESVSKETPQFLKDLLGGFDKRKP